MQILKFLMVIIKALNLLNFFIFAITLFSCLVRWRILSGGKKNCWIFGLFVCLKLLCLYSPWHEDNSAIEGLETGMSHYILITFLPGHVILGECLIAWCPVNPRGGSPGRRQLSHWPRFVPGIHVTAKLQQHLRAVSQRPPLSLYEDAPPLFPLNW